MSKHRPMAGCNPRATGRAPPARSWSALNGPRNPLKSRGLVCSIALPFLLSSAGCDMISDLSPTNARGRRVIWGALGSRSSVIFDLDQDGDLDIVTLEMNQPPMVLTSNLSEKKKLIYLEAALVGSKSNRSGIGATVRVIAGNDVYTKMQDGKSGYLSQSLYPLYFGHGNHTEVDRVEVTWPSGQFQTVDHDIELNRLISISESM